MALPPTSVYSFIMRYFRYKNIKKKKSIYSVDNTVGVLTLPFSFVNSPDFAKFGINIWGRFLTQTPWYRVPPDPLPLHLIVLSWRLSVLFYSVAVLLQGSARQSCCVKDGTWSLSMQKDALQTFELFLHSHKLLKN